MWRYHSHVSQRAHTHTRPAIQRYIGLYWALFSLPINHIPMELQLRITKQHSWPPGLLNCGDRSGITRMSTDLPIKLTRARQTKRKMFTSYYNCMPHHPFSQAFLLQQRACTNRYIHMHVQCTSTSTCIGDFRMLLNLYYSKYCILDTIHVTGTVFKKTEH